MILLLCFICLQDGSEFSISPSLRQTQYVEIFDPIVVVPELLFFPWDPVQQVRHHFLLKVSQGLVNHALLCPVTHVCIDHSHGSLSIEDLQTFDVAVVVNLVNPLDITTSAGNTEPV